MVAPAMAAPCASVTCPRTSAVETEACAKARSTRARRATRRSRMHLLVVLTISLLFPSRFRLSGYGLGKHKKVRFCRRHSQGTEAWRVRLALAMHADRLA